jgi:hypothetical protein
MTGGSGDDTYYGDQLCVDSDAATEVAEPSSADVAHNTVDNAEIETVTGACAA